MKRIIAIGGSDCIGGAGVQADVKTAVLTGVYSATALTCITVQNSRGVERIVPSGPELVRQQIEAVLADFVPDAAKIGMLPDAETADAIASLIGNRFSGVPVVLDPILGPTKGAGISEHDRRRFVDSMLNLASVASIVTPNFPEAYMLSGGKCADPAKSLLTILKHRGGMSTAILIKGGHDEGEPSLSVDRLYIPCADNDNGYSILSFPRERIDSFNTHGTGCVLSTAIASALARGYDLPTAVESAGDFLHERLLAGAHLDICGDNAYGPVLGI